MRDEPRQAGAGADARSAAAPDSGAREEAELIARLRHEINNPLTGLIGQAQLLLRDPGLSEEARRRVETMELLAKRIRDAVAALRAPDDTQSAPGHGAADKAGPQRDSAETSEDPPRH